MIESGGRVRGRVGAVPRPERAADARTGSRATGRQGPDQRRGHRT
ncbi:hypothetical protein [Saccharothrix australiensis]|nr:hypothetical protein [Saccharothrix australiensis]